MRKHHPNLLSTALFLLAAMSTSNALAQTSSPYFVEASVGHGKADFEQTYYFLDGAPPRTYSDIGKGSVASLSAGYSKQLQESLTLDVSADVIYQQTDFTLFYSSEPAYFKYEIPLTFALVASPSWQINSRWRIFVDAGIATGQTQFRKSQSPWSNYNFDGWTPGLLAGVGVAYRLGDTFEVTANYRAIQYDEVSYKSSHPTTGAHVETLYSDPSSTFGSVGLRYRF